jgi:hypothetical protein
MFTQKNGRVVDLGSMKGYFHVDIHIEAQILQYATVARHKINPT